MVHIVVLSPVTAITGISQSWNYEPERTYPYTKKKNAVKKLTMSIITALEFFRKIIHTHIPFLIHNWIYHCSVYMKPET